MTTTARASASRPSATGARLRLDGVLHSELLKLVTVRSTWWSIAISVLLALALALAIGSAATLEEGTSAAALVAGGTTVHLQFVGLVIAVLGALSVGGEYSTGMIRSTYTAVPRRLPSLVGRGVVVAAASFVVGLVTCSGSLAIIAPLLAGKGVTVPPLTDGLLASILGGAFYLAVVGAVSVGLGALLRSTAAAIGVSVGLLFVLPIITSIAGGLIHADWIVDASRFLLSNIGVSLAELPGAGAISDIGSVLAALGWVVAVWVPALLVTRVRDV
ncbi:ABC transporter permease subunit [Rathayibacter sp. VKM Ac-2760]|uniref:ABC transporter permease subunit n=1 Tax=Rathayibacter sp. VKM Ac-2760 TaxID=2609253 RepID=UPI001317D98A|nr:ABC transporter permease subunit [Rathayibacter sp. VKM Ac-2760]QHC59956.1 hypothetical protein GSU72_16425 [Rathayibacter sp. VKM Ac-2760]